MSIPTDFRASLLDLRRQIDACIANSTALDALGYASGGFVLGNWRIVPRFPQNPPSESPEASRKAFEEWLNRDGYGETYGNIPIEIALREVYWEAWQASRAQLNSPSPQ